MKYRPAHFERLLKFLRRKGRSHEDAEDLIQEAMLRLHRYRRAAVPVVNEEAFLTHAVQNLSIDLHRRCEVRREVFFVYPPVAIAIRLEGLGRLRQGLFDRRAALPLIECKCSDIRQGKQRWGDCRPR